MSQRSPITTHVLDTSIGKPGVGVKIVLEQRTGTTWSQIGGGVTDADGRVTTLLSPSHSLQVGAYRITFATEEYCTGRGVECFYPEVTIAFTVKHPTEHYHVPLLINPFGYSTYRGS